MTGLIVLGVLLAYIAIAVGIASLAKGAWRLFVIAVFVLIPTWDIIPGKIALAHYCDKEGGIKIYRSVDGVEGFLSLDGRVYEEYFKRYGYKYIEVAKEMRDPKTGKSVGNEYVRVLLGKDGKLREERVNQLISRYGFRDYRSYDTYVAPWGITLFSASVVDIQTGETIAVDKRFGWYGGWVRRANRPLLGAGDGCHTADNSYVEILLRALVPAKEAAKENKRG